MINPLKGQYEALLRQRGLERFVAPLSRDEKLHRFSRMSSQEQEYFADLIESVRDGTDTAEDTGPFERICQDIQATLERSDIPLPNPVYVDQYPHNAFNAQACAVTGGTLILINTGLMTLVHEIAKCLGLSLMPFRRSATGDIVPEQASPELTRQRDEARAVIARAVVAYIFHTDAGQRGRIPVDSRSAMGFHLTQSTERFVVGHEFGHLLSGHLDQSRTHSAWGELIRKTHAQEFEADEVGALLMLRGLEDGDQIQTNLATAGPFFFLAIDHLVTRVRNEVNDIPQDLVVTDHPPSDERAAALRQLFFETAGPGSLQFADAAVSWLSNQEDEILDFAEDAAQSLRS